MIESGRRRPPLAPGPTWMLRGEATRIECTVVGGGFVVGVDLDDTEAPVRIQTVDLEEAAR